MINLDTRILDELDGNELAVFCHIIKRINKKNESFPSRKLLMKETGFGRERVAKAIKTLSDKKIISHFQKKSENGKFSKTHYRMTTKYASVFINVDDEVLIDEFSSKPIENDRDTENRNTETTHTEKSPLSINHDLSINKNEVKSKKIDFKLLLDFLNKETKRNFRTINKTVQNKFKARLKDGYKKTDILNAIKNASNTDFHKNNGRQYLTPDFFSRASTLDKYGSEAVVVEKTEVSQKMNEGTFVNF